MTRLTEAEGSLLAAEQNVEAAIGALRSRAAAFLEHALELAAVSVRAPATASRMALVVEDNASLGQVFRRILEQIDGLRVGVVTTFAAAEVALGLLGPDVAPLELPDVAVIDMQLPDGDGWTLAQRALEARSTVRVVLVSGALGPELLEKLAHTTRARYLTKPMTAEELLEVVRAQLEG